MGYVPCVIRFLVPMRKLNGFTLHLLYNRKSLATEDKLTAGVSDMTASDNPT